MAEQPRAQLDVDPVGGVREEIGAQDAEHGLEQGDGDQPHHQHVERAHAAVHEHLVDHDLEEERRDQREQLDEERGQQDLAQEPAVLVHGAEEPGDVEAPGQIGELGPPGHQHQPAVPHGLELGARHQLRARLVGHLDQDLVLAGPAQQQEAAIAQDGDAGQGRARQPVPAGLGLTRFETELIGAAQHLRHTDGVGAELMANLAWIDAKALQSKQHHEGCKPPLIRTPGALTHLIPRRRRSPDGSRLL